MHPYHMRKSSDETQNLSGNSDYYYVPEIFIGREDPQVNGFATFFTPIPLLQLPKTSGISLQYVAAILAVEERINRAFEYKLQVLVKGARKITAGTPAAKNQETR